MSEEVEKWLEKKQSDFDFSDFRVVSKTSGESNNNWIIETDRGKRILRISRDISDNRLENEAKSLKFLQKQNISNIPQLIYFEQDSVLGEVLLETYIGQESVEPNKLTNKHLRELSNLIADIHIEPEKYNEFFDENERKEIRLKEALLEDFKKWGEEPYQEYLKKADRPRKKIENFYEMHKKTLENIESSLKLEKTFIHGDLAANIRKTSDELYIIDWELARLGCPTIEILYLFEHANLDSEKREHFLDCYQESRKLEKGFREARKIYPKSLAFNDMIWAAKRLEKVKENGGDVERYKEMLNKRLDKLEKLY